MNAHFETAAAELREREFSRLAAAVVPTLESLRSLTPKPFRAEVATMLERLGYHLVTSESVGNLVTTKDGCKYVVACAPPADFHRRFLHHVAQLHARGGSLRRHRPAQTYGRREAGRLDTTQHGGCDNARHL